MGICAMKRNGENHREMVVRPDLLEERQQFLRVANAVTGNEHPPAILDGRQNGLHEHVAPLLQALELRVAVGTLHNQHVQIAGRQEARGQLVGRDEAPLLVAEIARVEDRLPVHLHFPHHGA